MKQINIGGENRPIKYNINALMEFEELTGIDLLNDRSQIGKLKNLRALAFIGLKHGVLETNGEVKFTIEDVGRWLEPGPESLGMFQSIFSKDTSTGEPDGEESEEAKK